MPILLVENGTFGGGIMPDGWQDGFVAELEAGGVDVRLAWAQEPEDVQAEWLAEAHGLVMFSHTHIDAEFLDRAPNLQIVCTPSVGFDNIDAVECGKCSRSLCVFFRGSLKKRCIYVTAKRGIYVTNGAGSITETTADLALCLLLGACRRLGANHMAVVAGPEASQPTWFVGAGGLGDDPENKVLGVIGFGRIGQALAHKCRGAFNMEIIYYDPFHIQNTVVGARQMDTLDELLEAADFVSINSVLDDSSRHLIGKEQLAKMKKGAYLVNAARGPLVDEEALCDALESGHLAGAGLDVFEIEPPDTKPDGTIGPDERLRNAPNVFLQPHSGSATLAARQEMQYLCASNLKAALVDGRGPLTPVNAPLNPKL